MFNVQWHFFLLYKSENIWLPSEKWFPGSDDSRSVNHVAMAEVKVKPYYVLTNPQQLKGQSVFLQAV